MRTKYFVTCLAFATTFTALGMNKKDSLRIVELEKKINTEVAAREQLSSKIKSLNDLVQKQGNIIDSLRDEARQTADTIGKRIDKANQDISNTNTTLAQKADSTDVHTKAVGGMVGLATLAILGGGVFFFLRKKQQKNSMNVDQMKLKVEELGDKVVNNLNQEISELQKIVENIATMPVVTAPQSEEPDHKLVLGIANEVARIEQNLNNMDASVKGVSNLKNRAKSIIATLKSQGYEIPSLVGKTYNEGDNMDATMELDETLEKGTSIIRRVTKPLVMYQGKMIQAPKVVVAYNE